MIIKFLNQKPSWIFLFYDHMSHLYLFAVSLHTTVIILQCILLYLRMLSHLLLCVLLTSMIYFMHIRLCTNIHLMTSGSCYFWKRSGFNIYKSQWISLLKTLFFLGSALALHYSFVFDLLFLQGMNRNFCIHRAVKLPYSCWKMRSLHLLFFSFSFILPLHQKLWYGMLARFSWHKFRD